MQCNEFLAVLGKALQAPEVCTEYTVSPQIFMAKVQFVFVIIRTTLQESYFCCFWILALPGFQLVTGALDPSPHPQEVGQHVGDILDSLRCAQSRVIIGGLHLSGFWN